MAGFDQHTFRCSQDLTPSPVCHIHVADDYVASCCGPCACALDRDRFDGPATTQIDVAVAHLTVCTAEMQPRRAGHVPGDAEVRYLTLATTRRGAAAT